MAERIVGASVFLAISVTLLFRRRAAIRSSKMTWLRYAYLQRHFPWINRAFGVAGAAVGIGLLIKGVIVIQADGNQEGTAFVVVGAVMTCCSAILIARYEWVARKSVAASYRQIRRLRKSGVWLGVVGALAGAIALLMFAGVAIDLFR